MQRLSFDHQPVGAFLVQAMLPYYEESGITIYNADCRDVASLIPADVLITDPPYGINVGNNESARETRPGMLVKSAYAAYEDTPENYRSTVVPTLTALIKRMKRSVVFGFAPNIWLLPAPDVLGGIYVPAGCGRSKWGFTSFMPTLFYGTAPGLQNGAKPTAYRSTNTAERNGHPTPKPIEWLRWIIGLATEENDVVIDPFMGSGTTLLAAKQFGRKAIGIEISEEYCQIAIERLRQTTLNFETEAPKAIEPMSLF